MWGFDWEPVISAGLTGGLALVGIVLTIRSQSGKTRKAGLDQHTEQNQKLDLLLAKHDGLEKKVDQNKNVAEQGLSELKGQVGGLAETNNVLFGMIVELDKKVTKQPNKRKPSVLEELKP